ncbi:MAG: alpha/beta fold hydrolase, partial [Spirochaetia bacterium]|nr:alpha/beta fold hydrolase [Spirochaetia bacterium]
MADRTLYLTAQDGMNLVGTILEARRPRAVLVWLHGFAEHRRRYQHFGRWLVKQRITVAAIDLRGHGESGGRRGYVSRFDEYFYDVAALLHQVRKDYPSLKVFLGSHSNGCLIAARYLEEGRSPYPLSGLIMTSPFLGLGM